MARMLRRGPGIWLLLALMACLLPSPSHAAQRRPVLTIDLGRRGPTISPTMFGLMFEEINHAGDGGIYAELIANRAMLDNVPNTDPWTVEASGQAAGSLDLDTQNPVNGYTLPESLRLTITRVGTGERVGASNPGYGGIPVWPRAKYRASFYARSSAGFKGPLTIRLESATNAVLAEGKVAAVGSTWRHYALSFTSLSGIKSSADNHFVIVGGHPGTVWLSLVSLFPPTWKGRANGMRIDLMRALLALHPTFLRIPGGNYLEGQSVATRFAWKSTLGALVKRRGHQDDAWGYRSTDGLGLLEYLEWCEDLHVTPVLAVFAGYFLNGDYISAGHALQPYVRDALDEIQYATGSPATLWGARRAADGHPAPFTVRYVEIGNEDFFDRSASYDSRFAQFYDAIRAAYPSLRLIATSTEVSSRTPDLIDLHFYQTPDWFASHAGYFDAYSRRAPKVLVGEFAAQTAGDPIGRGPATLGTAIGEAAWMTGLERNADVVTMASYAPLFQNVRGYQWTPDLISYDSMHSYGAPSYYVQQLFSLNHGNAVVPTALSTGNGSLSYVASRDSRGTTVYLTVVNSGPAALPVQVAIAGAASVAASGTVTVLTSSSLSDVNSLDAPTKVHPVTRLVTNIGQSFGYRFSAQSVTIFQLSVTARRG